MRPPHVSGKQHSKKCHILRRKGVIPTAVATGIDIGLSNLSLKTITLTLYSKLSLNLGIPRANISGNSISHVQVISIDLRPRLRLSIQARSLFTSARLRYRVYHLWRVPHGIQRDNSINTWNHHGLLRIRSRWSPVGINTARDAQEGDGHVQPIRNDLLVDTRHGCHARHRQYHL